MTKTLAAVGCLGLALAGCATPNTPQQDLAYSRWARCATPYAQLERVELDGRITFQYSNSATRQEIQRCLTDAGRAGEPLPESRAVRPVGGP